MELARTYYIVIIEKSTVALINSILWLVLKPTFLNLYSVLRCGHQWLAGTWSAQTVDPFSCVSISILPLWIIGILPLSYIGIINIDHYFSKVKAFWVLQVRSRQFFDFVSVFNFLPNDLVVVFGIKLDQFLLSVHFDCDFYWFQPSNTAFDDEETLITCRTVAKNCVSSLVRFKYHGLVALVDCREIRLLFEVVKKLVRVEEQVQPFIVNRLLFVLMFLKVFDDFLLPE